MSVIPAAVVTNGIVLSLITVFGISGCRSAKVGSPPHLPEQRVVVSIADQLLGAFEDGKRERRYPVSTSRFGVGDRPSSCCTPLGRLEVVEIIGEGLPKGAVLKGREPTGEKVKTNAPGRDVIVTRIVRLRGTEPENAKALQRCIYIHGTPAERRLRKPVSWGCVRMGSKDIMRFCRWVRPGARVDIVMGDLPKSHHLPP